MGLLQRLHYTDYINLYKQTQKPSSPSNSEIISFALLQIILFLLLCASLDASNIIIQNSKCDKIVAIAPSPVPTCDVCIPSPPAPLSSIRGRCADITKTWVFA